MTSTSPIPPRAGHAALLAALWMAGTLAMISLLRGFPDRAELRFRESIETYRRSKSRRLGAAVLNLALNARDAMPDGGTLTISVAADEIDGEYVAKHPWSRPGKYVRITVADDGAGIDEETLPHIFDPFFTTRTNTGGTGLGLSVTRAIVEQHGGLVRASSKVGAGTAISVYLPALPAG